MTADVTLKAKWAAVKHDVWFDSAGGTEVAPQEMHRLYNPYSGEHHYTFDESEKGALVAAGWNYEGVGWCSDDFRTVPLNREYNPNAFANNHNYTTDRGEHEYLVSIGWSGLVRGLGLFRNLYQNREARGSCSWPL